MRIAADLMTPNPKMILSGQLLREVIKLFLEVGITSSPVINPVGEILGVLSEISLVKAYLQHKGKKFKNDKVGHYVHLLEPVNYIEAHAAITEVLTQMISAPNHRLLVKERDRIVGIISPKDLLRAMLGEANPGQNLRERMTAIEARLKESINHLSTVEKSLEIYQRAFHETPYMMHAVNAEGVIILANRREHEALGYAFGELSGKTIFKLYPEFLHSQIRESLRKIISDGHLAVDYTEILKKGGGTIKCDVASTALKDSSGKFVSTISVFRPLDADDLIQILSKAINFD